MIEKLEMIPEGYYTETYCTKSQKYEKYFVTEGYRYPNDREIFNKINEIIDYLNEAAKNEKIC